MPTNEGAPPVAAPEMPQLPAPDRLASAFSLHRVSPPTNEVTPYRVITVAFIIDYVDKKSQVILFKFLRP